MINQAYIDFIEFIKPFNVMPLHEYTGRGVALRHDVDDKLEIAMEMALFEYANNVRSTYFFLHTADYYPEYETFRKIQSLGHEIGFHNDLLTNYLKTGEKPKDCLKRELKKLKKEGLKIRGVCSHGSYLARDLRFLNYYVWQQFDMASSHQSFNSIRYDGRVYPIDKLNLYDYFQYQTLLLNYDYRMSDVLKANFNYRERLEKATKEDGILINIHPNQTKPVYLWIE